MKGNEYIVSLKTGLFMAEGYKFMVNGGINWYHRISDGVDEVSHKPMSL
jgi:hypothetical protein